MNSQPMGDLSTVGTPRQGLSASPDAKKPSQIAVETAQLNTATSNLNDFVEQLEKKLETVLRNEPEKDEGTKDESSLIPAAHTIRNNRISVSIANTRLSSIINRLEV